MKQNTLALQLLIYHGSEYLEPLFDSLIAQKDRDWTFYILNNSTDHDELITSRFIVDRYKDSLNIIYQENEENNGFAGGHQQLFEMHKADLVMLVNQDAVLESNYIEELRNAFDQNEELGAAAGIIYRYLFADGEIQKTEIIDSLGLRMKPWWKVEDIGAGELLPEKIRENVFGVSGCLPIYRRKAIESSSYLDQLFDPQYVIYKEDVGLAYRLKRAKWKAKIIPEAIAYHRRSFQKQTRKEINWNLQYYSYRNHLWNILTYLRCHDILIYGAFIFSFECTKFGYFLLKKPSILIKTLKNTMKYWPQIKKKRSKK